MDTLWRCQKETIKHIYAVNLTPQGCPGRFAAWSVIFPQPSATLPWSDRGESDWRRPTCCGLLQSAALPSPVSALTRPPCRWMAALIGRSVHIYLVAWFFYLPAREDLEIYSEGVMKVEALVRLQFPCPGRYHSFSSTRWLAVFISTYFSLKGRLFGYKKSVASESIGRKRWAHRISLGSLCCDSWNILILL